MKITKELKYATFEYNEEEKDFVIEEQDGNKVILNKVYAFAFMRFVIRMAQRNWLRQMKKSDRNLNKTTTDDVLLDQMEFNEADAEDIVDCDFEKNIPQNPEKIIAEIKKISDIASQHLTSEDPF